MARRRKSSSAVALPLRKCKRRRRGAKGKMRCAVYRVHPVICKKYKRTRRGKRCVAYKRRAKRVKH